CTCLYAAGFLNEKTFFHVLFGGSILGSPDHEWRTKMKRSDLKRFCLTVALVLAAAYIAAAPPGTYHLIKKIPLGAAPGGTEYFDYITFDPSTRRVYLSHGTEVKVLEADSGNVLGTVTGLKRDHGVVALNELGRGFITDGEAREVVVFDLKTFKITG